MTEHGEHERDPRDEVPPKTQASELADGGGEDGDELVLDADDAMEQTSEP
jgi:hypothetical protein